MEALTSKQLEVAQMLVSRRSYEAIGAALGIKKHTVKAHAEQIYRRLGIYDGREELRREFRLQLGEFVPESLEGYWLSRFEFVSHKEGQGKTARLTSGTQINLEVIERSSDKFIAHTGFNYTGHSVCVAPSGIQAYEHTTCFRVNKNIAVGVWVNSNTENAGTMHLVIRSDGRGMGGMYLGNSSDFSVRPGPWLWRRVVPSSSDLQRISQENFKSIDELDRLFAVSVDRRQPIQLRDLFV